MQFLLGTILLIAACAVVLSLAPVKSQQPSDEIPSDVYIDEKGNVRVGDAKAAVRNGARDMDDAQLERETRWFRSIGNLFRKPSTYQRIGALLSQIQRKALEDERERKSVEVPQSYPTDINED